MAKRANLNKSIEKIPSYLDPLAKKYYKFLIDERKDLLTNLDIPIIEQMSDTLSKLRQCDEILNREQILIRVTDRYGHEVLKEHPTVKTKMQYLNQFKTLSAQIGMSPSSRAQLAGMQIENQKEEIDPVLKLLAGGGN